MKHRYLENVVTLQLNEDKCSGCGICLEVCPHGVLKLTDKRILISDRDLCMECGACAANCAFEAITVKAGVGCAAALLKGAVTGREATCGCSGTCC